LRIYRFEAFSMCALGRSTLEWSF